MTFITPQSDDSLSRKEFDKWKLDTTTELLNLSPEEIIDFVATAHMMTTILAIRICTHHVEDAISSGDHESFRRYSQTRKRLRASLATLRGDSESPSEA